MTASGNPEGLSIQPMAGGQPLPAGVADQAAEWLTVLMSGEATDADRRRWRHWRDAHPDHDRAWLHIEAVTGRLKLLQPQAAYRALSSYADAEPSRPPGRRKALRLLVGIGVAGAVGLLASRTRTWQEATADYRTGTGEQRTVTLDDGTRVTLNTASAVDVRFDAARRRLRLVAGEVLIATGHAGRDGIPDRRPFIVETTEGRIRALGTRFTVRQGYGRTSVAVLESAVEITPDGDTGQPRLLQAGERLSFTRTTSEARGPVDEQASAWTHGQIVADNVRLGDFMAEIGRYRSGFLHCDPAVADLRLSGVFPLQDTDRILATLPNVLPVRVRLRTRYWVTVEAAG